MATLSITDRHNASLAPPAPLWQLIHLSNGLFLLALNSLPFAVRLVLLALYAVHVWHGARRQAVWAAPSRGTLAFAVALVILLALEKFAYLEAGWQSIPNWDYLKYNALLTDIARAPLHPEVGIAGERHALSYYYAIYLPAIWAVAALEAAGLLPAPDVFVLQAAFNGWFVLLLAAILLAIDRLVGRRTALAFVAALVLLGGLDGLGLLLLPAVEGTLFSGDIQKGGIDDYFYPIRIQDFTSAFFWLPGHVTTGMFALFCLIGCQLKPTPRLGLYAIPCLIFILSTSPLIFVSLTLYLAALMRERYLRFTVLGPLSWLALLLILAGFAHFFASDTAPRLRYLFSAHLLDYGAGKFALVLVQELGPFLALGLVLRIAAPDYWLSIFWLLLLSLVGSENTIMVAGILPLLVMLWRIGERVAHGPLHIGRAIALAVMVALYLPSLVANWAEHADLAGHRLPMTAAAARGETTPVMPAVLRQYVRRSSRPIGNAE